MTTTPLSRAQFPVSDSYCYVNHAGVAPLSKAAGEIGRAYIDDFVARGAVGFVGWEERLDGVRRSAGRLMGVPADDVAFVKNTTEGLGFVANGLSWEPGDRVLVPDREFPSTVYPWLSLRELGVQVDLIQPVGDEWRYPLEAFEAALRAAPTRLVAVSWVHFGRGWRTDLAALAELCHAHGALLCADVIQGLGVVPAEFEHWGVDFAMADAHKWLLGPLGAGVFYVAAGCRDLLRPLEPGWASVAHREEWDNLALVYDDSARRFEGGSHNIGAILQMGASMDLLLDAGVDRVFAHVSRLLDHLAGALTEAGAVVVSSLHPDSRSGHLTFTVAGHEPTDLWERLEAGGIVCSPRGGGIRIAPHGYNTLDEMDAVADAVRRLPAG